MARTLVRVVVVIPDDDGNAVLVENAAVDFERPGGGTPVVYEADTGGSPLAMPIATDSDGACEVWIEEDEPRVLDAVISDNAGTAVRAGTIEPIPFDTFTAAARASSQTAADLADDSAFTDRFVPKADLLDRALATYRESHARMKATGTRAMIAIVGDSGGEGYLADSITGVWWRRLLLELQQPTERAHGGYIAAIPGAPTYGYPGFGNDLWTRAGAVHNIIDQGRGLGRRAVDIGPGSSMQFVFTGCQVQFAYTKMASSPVNGFRLSLNGVPGDIDPHTAGADESALYTGPLLAYGIHTVKLENVGVSGNIRVEGIHIWDSAPTYGVYIADASHAGYGAEHYATPDTSWVESVALLDPDLILIMIGGNDYFGGRTSEQFQGNLQTMCEALAAGCPRSPGIIIVAGATPAVDLDATEPWANFTAAMANVAAMDPAHRAVLDIGARTHDGTIPESLIAVDEVHINNSGGQWLSDILEGAIQPVKQHGPARMNVQSPVHIDASGGYPDGVLGSWTNVIVTTGASATFPSGTVYWQSPVGTTVHEHRYRVWLERGTYLPVLTGVSGTVSGIAEVLIGSVSSGDLDFYAATGSIVSKAAAGAMSIWDDGWYCVTIRKTGRKNASSTAWSIFYTDLDLVRSA